MVKKLKIKKLLITLLIITPLLTSFGQKIKVKNEILSIDKKEVGFFVEKKIYERQKQFAILNQQKDTVFKVGREVVFSTLDGEDEIYLYESFSIPNKRIKLGYSIGETEYYLNPKSILRHFLSKGLIDKELNLNEAKLAELLKNKNEFPQDIKEVLDQEKSEMNDLNFISEKAKNGVVSLKKVNSTSKSLKYLYRPNRYYFDTYEVFSSNENEELQIGKVVIRYPEKSASLGDAAPVLSGDISRGIIFVYNLKGGRVARLAEIPFGKLKIYKNNISKEKSEHQLFEYKPILIRTTKLIESLIRQDKL